MAMELRSRSVLLGSTYTPRKRVEDLKDGDSKSHSGLEPETTIKLRSYQTEMVEASLKRNIIVAMDTGSGKTFIAVERIRIELERCQPSKLVWFLAPKVALCQQQYEVLKTHLAAYQCRFLSGADNVDRWTEQKLWDAILLNIRVVVSTPAVLNDALTHGFVKLGRIALCVFDEAHNCTKRNPANQMMEHFYKPNQAKGDEVPHILGLTASPVFNPKEGALSTGSILTTYDITRDPYVLDLEQELPESVAAYTKTLMTGRTYCKDQIQALWARALKMLPDLGPFCVDWYLHTCVSKCRAGVRKLDTVIMPQLSEKERIHLLKCLESISLRPGLSISAPLPPCGPRLELISTKVNALIDVLQRDASSSFMGIVFAEQRATVAALAHLLSNHPRTSQAFNIGTFVGSSTSANRKQALVDLIEPREQQHTLEDFRLGKKNLIIATNVLEEGIDVSTCNSVICFDPPKNLVSFVQRRGRARKQQSTYVMLLEESESTATPIEWHQLEEEMKAAYLNDQRELQVARGLEETDEYAQEIYRIASTG
ncbi:Dicer-like protein 2 [Elasticomyces elasticus]|nr:Dicer-like protein 2 [Elasticomyces elasticus]